MEIEDGHAMYSYKLNLTNFALASSCSLSSSGLKYHIHSYWTNGSVTSSAGSTYCGSAYTGGHYDPNFACSSSSQEISSGCVNLGRTSSQGYTYSCNTTLYKEGDYSNCEVGDLSGKIGIMYPQANSLLFSANTTAIDYLPAYIANYKTSIKNAIMWSSIVFHCGANNNRLLCASFSNTDTAACSSAFSSFSLSPTVSPTTFQSPTISPTSLVPTTTNSQYCATIRQNQTSDASGYFAIQIKDGIALYSYNLNLNNFSLASSCPLTNGGSTYCGTSYTGGHYDPNFACSSSSQEISSGCKYLNRTSSSGYTYTCNTTVYGKGDYSECEVGDLSGKFGTIYPSSGYTFSSSAPLSDLYPPYISNYDKNLKNSYMWSSVVFHCASTGTRLLCAELSETDTSACSSAFGILSTYTSPPTNSPSSSPTIKP
eukprot:gene20958-27162_t